jgi:hypothetical protein
LGKERMLGIGIGIGQCQNLWWVMEGLKG